MSNYKAITGSSKIVNRNQGGGSYAFAPSADGVHKYYYCGHKFDIHTNKHLIFIKKDNEGYTIIAST